MIPPAESFEPRFKIDHAASPMPENERKVLEPLTRFTRGDVRGHIAGSQSDCLPPDRRSSGLKLRGPWVGFLSGESRWRTSGCYVGYWCHHRKSVDFLDHFVGAFFLAQASPLYKQEAREFLV
jgi:hypothetical protein